MIWRDYHEKDEKSNLWYNPRSKEIGGILLESREAVRCGRLYPDVRAGLRFMGVHAEFQTTIL